MITVLMLVLCRVGVGHRGLLTNTNMSVGLAVSMYLY